MITRNTAYEICLAYNEIESGQKLMDKIREDIKNGSPPDLRDPFGRQRNLQLGVPMGDSGHRVLDVKPELAFAIIENHIADKKALLTVLNQRAKTEVDGDI